MVELNRFSQRWPLRRWQYGRMKECVAAISSRRMRAMYYTDYYESIEGSSCREMSSIETEECRRRVEVVFVRSLDEEEYD